MRTYYGKVIKSGYMIINFVEKPNTIGNIKYDWDTRETSTSFCEDIEHKANEWIDLGFVSISEEEMENEIFNYRYRIISSNILLHEKKVLEWKERLYKLLNK